MGTWSVPYENMKSARLFAQRMKSPWIAKVTYDPQDDYYEFDAPDLYRLFGDDGLYDELGEKATRGKNFDIRPYVKKELKPWLQQQEASMSRPAPLEPLNIVRVALGLKALPEHPVYTGPQRVGQKILELCAEAGIVPRNMLLQEWPGNKTKRKIYLFGLWPTNPVRIPTMQKILKSLPVGEITVPRYGPRIVISFDLAKIGKVTLAGEQSSFALHFKDKKSDKFWHAQQKGKNIALHYGRSGSEGQKLTKKYATPQAALTELHKLARQKKSKGYREAKT